METLQARVGNDLQMWLDLLHDMRQARVTFETARSFRQFQSVEIHFDQLQSRIQSKYDVWQSAVVDNLAKRSQDGISGSLGEMQRARYHLESSSLQSTSTAETVSFITLVSQTAVQLRRWSAEASLFGAVQTTLSRLRYRFEKDWIYADQAADDQSALSDLVSRKEQLLDQQRGEQIQCYVSK